MKKSSLLGYTTGFGIGLASLIPGTVTDKVSIDDVVANLQPENSQEQVIENNYKPDSVIDYAKNVVGPKNAYAGGMDEIMEAKDRCSRETGQDNCIYVDDYYNVAKPVNDPEMPDGLRKIDMYKIGGSKENEAVIKSKAKRNPDNFDNGLFTDYFFNPKYNEPLKEIFAQDGYEQGKIQNFFRCNNNEKSVSMYHDGYMLLFNTEKQNTYIFPISNEIINDILEL